MEQHELRRRFGSLPVARLSTVGADGAPHVVPVVFAVVGDLVYTAVDDKPKRSPRLKRLANLRHEPRCALLVDHYEDDWSRLWWVRADGIGAVLDAPAEDHPGWVALTQRHWQYQRTEPAGPLVEITIGRWSGWSGSAT